MLAIIGALVVVGFQQYEIDIEKNDTIYKAAP